MNMVAIKTEAIKRRTTVIRIAARGTATVHNLISINDDAGIERGKSKRCGSKIRMVSQRVKEKEGLGIMIRGNALQVVKTWQLEGSHQKVLGIREQLFVESGWVVTLRQICRCIDMRFGGRAALFLPMLSASAIQQAAHLINQVYFPLPPSTLRALQPSLFNIQRKVEAWGLVVPYQNRKVKGREGDGNVRFWSEI
ncbi:hypothetical protein JAAARDRAFT_79549 [Jaapia argillacea MUCL 33604]|uniref:Uncharacterized protein n=1 Tax=Jaapia argillacea MUCL 33604 TaxID=933084 RepID=A0A067PMP3_9AGAM|nr:hypothetical protein JAAARDRAFT_79549 [Jaapia argillacea MUCL 33604]